MGPKKNSKPAPKPEPKPRRIHRKKPGAIKGRPEFVPTDDDRQLVRRLAGYKIPQAEIALLVKNPTTNKPISKTTLEKCFPDELEEGYANLRMRIMAATVRSALGVTKEDRHGNVLVEKDGNVTAQIWLQKILYGFREKTDVAVPPAGSAGVTDPGGSSIVEDARRVAFTLALGAHMVGKPGK